MDMDMVMDKGVEGGITSSDPSQRIDVKHNLYNGGASTSTSACTDDTSAFIATTIVDDDNDDDDSDSASVGDYNDKFLPPRSTLASPWIAMKRWSPIGGFGQAVWWRSASDCDSDIDTASDSDSDSYKWSQGAFEQV
ncbi:hypothetical protein PINS_up010538 [Pythium insidiosum]|nr:hypothetical protein PINS_up010538 [Pythium insidiosum]